MFFGVVYGGLELAVGTGLAVERMPPEQTDTNPYASPKSHHSSGASRARRRFRWRLIPTSLLYLHGVGFVLIAFAALGMLLWMMVAEPLRLTRDPIAVAMAFICAVALTVAGSLLILAARACWRAGKGDWRRAGVFTVFGFGLYTLTFLFQWVVYN